MKEQEIALDEAKNRITHWRQTRTKLRPIPESVWDAVLPLVGKYSYSTISKALGLSYEQIRGKIANRNAKSGGSTHSFVTIGLPNITTNEKPLSSCKIHLSKPDGVTLLIDGANEQFIQKIISDFMRPIC